MRDFRTLQVWEKSRRLTLEIYRATRQFPGDERFGLTSQMRRASASTAENIGEGCGRTGDRELARFMRIACGSASELEYEILLARDLGYMKSRAFAELTAAVQEIRRMMTAFVQRLIPRAES